MKLDLSAVLLPTSFLLLTSSPTLGQCWKCLVTPGPPAEVSCVEAQSGRLNCDVECSGEKCKCTTSGACKAEGPVAQKTLTPATKAVSGLELSLDRFGIRVYDTMLVELNPATRAAVQSMPGVFALFLELADRDGQLRTSVEEEDGYFTDKTTNEVYAYRGNVAVQESMAIITLELFDHPQIQTLRAEVRQRGNSGSLTVVDHTGQRTTQTW